MMYKTRSTIPEPHMNSWMCFCSVVSMFVCQFFSAALNMKDIIEFPHSTWNLLQAICFFYRTVEIGLHF